MNVNCAARRFADLILTRFAAVVFIFSLQAGVAAQPPAPAQTGRQLTRETVNRLPATEKRWALLIGVDNYQDGGITALRGSANDARALAAALRDYAGFDEKQIVVLTTDEPRERQPTRQNILRRLSNLKGLVPKDGLLFISFAGHGIERGGQAFLIPSDASFTDDISLLEETAISVDRVKNQIRAIGVGQVLILLDACRNDPAGGRSDAPNPLTEAYTRGFSFDARNKEVTAFATLYATSVGARAYEYAEKKQGYFSWAVVEALSGKAANQTTGEVTLGSLVRYVENNVPRQVAIDLGAGKRQTPFAIIEGYKADELVLAVGKNDPRKSAENIALWSDLMQARRWREIEKSSDPQVFEQFLKDYPNGSFAAAAQAKLQQTASSGAPKNSVEKPKLPRLSEIAAGFEGRVIDAQTNAPLAGALIQFVNLNTKAVVSDKTMPDGKFLKFVAGIGKYEIRVALAGYELLLVEQELTAKKLTAVDPFVLKLKRKQ